MDGQPVSKKAKVDVRAWEWHWIERRACCRVDTEGDKPLFGGRSCLTQSQEPCGLWAVGSERQVRLDCETVFTTQQL